MCHPFGRIASPDLLRNELLTSPRTSAAVLAEAPSTEPKPSRLERGPGACPRAQRLRQRTRRIPPAPGRRAPILHPTRRLRHQGHCITRGLQRADALEARLIRCAEDKKGFHADKHLMHAEHADRPVRLAGAGSSAVDHSPVSISVRARESAVYLRENLLTHASQPLRDIQRTPDQILRRLRRAEGAVRR